MDYNLVLFAAVSAFYYFRIIQAMYFREDGPAAVDAAEITPGFKILLVLTVLFIIAIGIYPEFVIGWMYH